MILIGLFFVSFIFIIIGIISRSYVKKIHATWLIPKGKIIYDDLRHSEKPLYSPTIRLSGKPDYIIQTKDSDLIPVEVKSGNHQQPAPWHVLQLLAYCYLITEAYQQDVPYGKIVYSYTKKQFKIPYDTNAQSLLQRTIQQMKDHMMTQYVDRNHDEKERCIHCSYRSYCKKKIL